MRLDGIAIVYIECKQYQSFKAWTHGLNDEVLDLFISRGKKTKTNEEFC